MKPSDHLVSRVYALYELQSDILAMNRKLKTRDDMERALLLTNLTRGAIDRVDSLRSIINIHYRILSERTYVASILIAQIERNVGGIDIDQSALRPYITNASNSAIAEVGKRLEAELRRVNAVLSLLPKEFRNNSR